MDIHSLFEKYYADQFDTTPEAVRNCLLSNGSYNNLCIARAFRMFNAGYALHKQDPLELLGYLSRNGFDSAHRDGAACFKKVPSAMYCIPVFTRGKHK